MIFLITGVILYPKLVHLYGSFYINSFGVCLALALVIFIFFVSKDSSLKKILNIDDVINITIYTAIIGVISGRLLYIITEFPKYESFWDIINISNGGGSVLGSVIGAMIYLIAFAYKRNLPVLQILDIAGIYAPIIHSISRIGCFLAGCCYGCQSNLPWAITYTNPETIAPLYVSIHPTQLYSAGIFFLIFLFLYFGFAKAKSRIPGLAFSVYLILSCIERLFVDFIRGDRTFLLSKYEICKVFSFHQLVALSLLSGASIFLIMINFRRNTVKV